MARWAIAAAALLVAAAQMGCGAGGSGTIAGTSSGTTGKWTVLVYMDADSDLEEYGVLNMNQMESVGSSDDVRIVVQMDRCPGYDATNGDWRDARRYLVQKDSDITSITSSVVESLGEVDMGDPQALNDFITWGTTNYPAEHLALVLWNHGAGWRSRAGAPGSRGILFDDTSDTYMTMAELNTGMTVPNVHFDLTAIDCSLMGMLEVCYEIKDRTDLVAASEESPPGEGYPYDAILAKVAANPSMTAEALGTAFVDEHVAHYSSATVTQSLVDTSRLAALGQKVSLFAAALAVAEPAHEAAFTQARLNSQSYAYAYYRDLYDFAAKAKSLISDQTVSTTADAVMSGISGTNGGPVLAEGHSLASVSGSRGLSIYLPGAGQYYSGYSDLRFSQDYPTWNQMLQQVIQ